MIDQIKLTPDRLFLKQEAVGLRSTTDRFSRSHHVNGKTGDGTVTLVFKIERYGLVKIRAINLKDGRWWVNKIEAVLPSLLRGCNGRPIQDARELALALTILVHIVKEVVEPGCHGSILPGLGVGNQGYIDACECMVQVQDPDHSFLHGSHHARLKNQHKRTGIYFGESSKLSTREVAISIYDKDAQLRLGTRYPEGIDGTRIEAVVKDEERLAKDAKATGSYAGKPGPILATLTLDTAYGILRKNLMRMSGVGWMPNKASLKSLCKNARIIAGTLGDDIRDPRQVHSALEAYRTSCNPSPNTFREVERDLRAYAVRAVVPDPLAIVPLNAADINWSEVRWPDRETAWAILMRDIGAPTEPDPAIVEAWAETTFLATQPLPEELIGSVAPARPPFMTNIL